MISEQDIQIINAVPLTDVMLAWGLVPHTEAKNGSWAGYLCPWHDDHRPSLIVDKTPRKGATDLGFKCMACKQEGFGAMQLAARLMGKPAGQLSADDFKEVVCELAERMNIETKDYIPGSERLRSVIMGPSEFREHEPQYQEWDGEQPIFEQGEWTVQGLKALGLRLEQAMQKIKVADGSEDSDTPLVRIGDMLAQFDPDTGEALYRCSLGRDFYQGHKKAETRTIAEWGRELEERFHIFPVKRFIKLQENEETHGHFVLIVNSNPSYPIFMFRYPFGIKKYEPLTRKPGTKWTWWNLAENADLEHRYYADSDLEDYLEGVMPTPDPRHPFVETEKGKDGSPVKIRFERVVLCSGPRDALQVWAHSTAHVVWLHSESSGFDQKGSGTVRPNRWLRSFIKKLLGVTVEGRLYVCYDEDATGLAGSQAIALNDPQVRWLRLPAELTQIQNNQNKEYRKPLKDVTDFITHFAEVERLMPADVQHDDPVEWFDNALFDTPTCQFWQWESERKEKDGTSRNRYKFDLRNVPVFLRARGMVRSTMAQGKASFSRFFLLGNDHTYAECFPGEKGANKLVALARDLMAEWLKAHKEQNDKKGALSRAIYNAKLEQSTLEVIEQMDFDDKSFGSDFDHFFFENTAVKVTKDGIETVPYSRMRWWTNREGIMSGRFVAIPQSWRVIVNPQYASQLDAHEEMMKTLKTSEERAQENMRWDAWSSLWHYKLILDKPLDEMPLHFRFLYNSIRIWWEKEALGDKLTATERQMQDMYFITAVHALGSALVRHRTRSRQQFVHITDNGTRREELASGGTGKSAYLDLLALVRPVLKIDGKALEGANISLTQELAKVVPGLHSIVCLDELPMGFSPKSLYNLTASLTARGLYRESMTLEGDDVPKFVVASNEQIDLSSESTSRRTYQLLVSDYYHPRSMDGSRPAHTPSDDFAKQYHIDEVARNLPPVLLNEARNLLLACVQVFFQFPDETIRPPKDNRAMLRQALAASKDKQFTQWIDEYLSKPYHRAQPIAQRELAISLLDYCGITVGQKTIDSAYARIRKNMDDYLRTSAYVCNPPVVLLTASDRKTGFRQCAAWQHPKGPDGYSIATDDKGNRLPRVKTPPYPKVYYFYRKSEVPRHFYDPKHAGDKDYVQGAPDIDPETETL